MLLTYKIKHGRDFSNELAIAKHIAEFTVQHKGVPYKHIRTPLPSAIVGQIQRKYARNKNIKKVHSVKLIVPNQVVKLTFTISKDVRRICTMLIKCLNLKLEYYFPPNFQKINQIELGEEYAYVSVTVAEKEQIVTDNYIGVDLNATSHCAVVGNPKTGKIWKLGKEAQHIHVKYSKIRRRLQRLGKYRKLKSLKNREHRIVKDLNHKISKKIVEIAEQNNCGIKLEELKGIRKRNKRTSRAFRYSLNSWSFSQLGTFIGYKAKLQGIPVVYIPAKNTSKACSRCGEIGKRQGKLFTCPSCGHVDHSDVNAAFNIALVSLNNGRSSTDRDVLEGSTDTPKEATLQTPTTLEPSIPLVGRVCQSRLSFRSIDL